MPKMSIVLWGGAPWGFRLQGGGHNALVISRVTSNGKASGAGVRVGSKVTSINGTPTSSLTLSAAHALTKQGSALTLELETEPSTPYPSISSVSSSASSCATVIPARTPISNHNIEKTHSNSKNETNLSSKESDPEESKNKRDSFADDDDSENRNSIDLASLLSTENSQKLRDDRRVNSDYTSLSESSTSDGYRQTLTEGEELNLTDISAPPSETSESTAVESEYDYGSLNSERNSYKDNNEESYNISDVNYERDEIYPDLHAESRHPLVESGYDCNNDPLVDNIRYYSTILEESEEDESAAHSSEAFGLRLNMGQHFSNNSGGADRNSKKKKQNIDKIDECRNSSHASSEGWRLSQTSTNSNVSSSTGGGGSDDTLGQNMSELSSINSHLSRLGQTSDDFKSFDRNEVNYYVQDIKRAKNDPDATPVVTPVAVKKNNTIIKNAIDELEIIEQAAQHLLQQSQSSPGRSSSRRLLNPSLLPPKVVEEKQFSQREVNTKKHVDQSTNLIEKYIYNNDGTYTVNGVKINAQKAEKKLKLTPTDDRGVVPTTEVKRRQWTKCTQLQPYISRESYNEDDFIKEIESLRGSYRESDLNDFLDKLESSGVKNSLDEDQYEQLIADIKADAERPNSIRGSKESLQIETNDKKLIKSSQESLTKSKSSTMKKFERLKERMLVLIRGKSRKKGGQKNDTLNGSNVSSETNGISKHDVINTSQPIAKVSETHDSNKTLEVKAKKTSIEPTKIEEKKGFKIPQFLKMGSPRLSRKEYGAKADKQDISVSDTEIDDHDTKNKETKKILRKSNGSLPNISENKTSPTGSQELKKEVRFNLKLEEVSNGYEKPVMKICEPNNSSQIVKELVNETGSEVPKIPTASQKDLKEHKSEIPLPATVAEINKMNKLRENANTRAEHLLPKLPERIKPPRRKKKNNLIPATVESISLESFESLSQKSSDDSSAASPKNSIIFERENILEKTQEAVLSSQEEFKPLDPIEHYQDILDINKFKTHEAQNEQINSKFDAEELLITETESPADAVDKEKEKRNLLNENEINKFNKDESVPSRHIEKLFKQEVKEEVRERSDNHLMEVETEATNKITPNVILPYIETPSNITINQEDAIENDIICETEKPVSHFKKDTTPGFPESEETMASFYDNMNPYYEAMTKLEEEVEDVASYYESQHNQNKDEIILDSKVKDKIKLFEREGTVKDYDVSVIDKENNILSSMEKTLSEHAKSLLNNDTSTKNLINITNVCESIDGDISKNSRQEALSSLENENKAYCIDDLNILTEEIARLANDMERDMNLQIESANLENDNVINNTVQNVHGQHYKTNDIFRKEMATMSTQTEVTLRKTVRKPEIVSQTDTEFEETDLDFETESEVEYANSSRTQPKQTNPYFGPSTSYTKTETLVSSIGRSSETTPTPKKQPPVVPPRQFQQKMPLNVVRELKYFLSDNGEESRLKKPELPPRWDSILTVNNGRCISDVSNNNNNSNNSEMSKPSLHATSNVDSGQGLVSAADPQSVLPLTSSLSSNKLTSSNLITSSVIKYTKHNRNEKVDRPKSYCGTSENLAPIPEEVLNSLQRKSDVLSQPSFLGEVIKNNSKDTSYKLNIWRIRANVYPFFDPIPKISHGKPPVPRSSNNNNNNNNSNNNNNVNLHSSTEEGYMSDPGPQMYHIIKIPKIQYGSVTYCDFNLRSKHGVISVINKSKMDKFKPDILAINAKPDKIICSTNRLPPRPPLPINLSKVYSDKLKMNADLSLPVNSKENNALFIEKEQETNLESIEEVKNQESQQNTQPISNDLLLINSSQTLSHEIIYPMLKQTSVESRPQSIMVSVPKPNEEDPKEENNNAEGNSGTMPENKQTCSFPRQRPLTWCTQSDFEASYLLHTQINSNETTYKTNIENFLLDVTYDNENPLSRPPSQLSQCSSQRLQAQGLGEWLFLARLDHTNQLLSQLNFAMQLQLDRSPGELSEYNEKIIEISEKKSSSPPPPPRPRTPIDERDPEQVYAERRYLSYFEGGPRAKYTPGDEPPKPPSYQQVEAQKRYANYFIGPPQANPDKLPLNSPDLENDEDVLAAKRRYEGYFKSGPPRPKSYGEPERPADDDEITLQAKQRYNSYFKSSIPRSRSTVSEDKTSEPDETQMAAEKRYRSYFQPGPPRRRSTASEEPTLELDEEQKAAEKRYLSYFHPGPPPPRRRSTASQETPTDPDEAQKAAEKRYLSYFQHGPPRPRSNVEDVRPSEPDEVQIEAEKRYAKYFEGLPKAKHGQNEVKNPEITAEMVAAEERFLKYFQPTPYGAPKKIIEPPPPSEEEMKKTLLFMEFKNALESRDTRKQMKIVKVSKPKKEREREKTPPTLREIVVDEFLQRVQDRKKEKDLHFGDTDDEEEQEDITKFLPKSLPAVEPIIQGGGTVDKRISHDLELFVKEEEVWSPGGEREARSSDGPSKIEVSDLPSFKDVPPIWTPARAGSASPSFGRKEYKRLHFEGTTLPRKSSQENVSSAPRPEESFAWKDREAERLKSTLPRVQSPTVTLLQKKREGQIPGPRPDYMHQDEAYYKPGDKLYTIKREYESEDEEVGSRKFAVLGPRKIEGVGPTTRDGVPVTLKSGVKSEHQGEWYRRMFDSLHKVRDEDYIVIKYKSPKARYGGYMSEPDGYDSDIGSSRYISLDRRNKKFEVDVSDTNPKNTKRYVHQPGRIENYIPGFSSLSEKELRDNPEADVKLEIKTKEAAPVPTTQRFGSSRMQMSNALKDTGYESDSTLVFRKREDHRRRYLDPKHSSQAYRQVQQGGDIPLTGLQKPAPARPRDSPYKYNSSEVNIHYRTPVRVEHKESLSEEELARRQEEHMKKVYEQERRKKYLAELEDIERRRHTDNFTPLQKSPIPLNRYDDETFGGPIGAKTPEPKQVARALFNFSAQNKRELSFNKGDIVTIRRAIDRNWYEGEVRGVVGIFPCNYVEVIPFDSLKTLGRKPTEGQARTRFNFQAQTAMEMSLTKGEMVILTRRVDENWYEGRVGNRRGIFPVTYVDVLAEPGGDRPISPNRDPIPRPALPAAHLLYNGTSGVSSPYSTTGRSVNQSETKAFTQLTVNTQQDSVPYRALYNYKPQNEDELELIEGDIVLVMEKCDDGWFVGTSKRTGLFGTFPGNYVERC